ncbi:MAG: 16S rRNA (cytosine(1402)-N(4))-methyltransferase RsmH [Chloroflexota bacterium]
MKPATEHIPVLLDAVLSYLRPRAGGVYVDGTLGGGGHAAALLAASGPEGRLLGMDVDPRATARAAQALAGFGSRVLVVNRSYVEMATTVREQGLAPVDGIVLDLGLSSHQLAEGERGFSFQQEAPLDMRFDQRAGATAAELLATLSETELADLIYLYGEERRSRALARAIVQARSREPFTTTTQLAAFVRRIVGGKPGGIHPATRTFQALRIAVNGELDALESVLPQTMEILRPGGRVAIISFHSLEDRLVKRFFLRESTGCLCPPSAPVCTCGHQPRLQRVTKKPVVASPEEVAANPRSRSAKLRVAERLEVAA